MKPVPLSGLYALTPDEAQRERLLALVERALGGGVRLLQYRDKLSPPAERLARARELRALCSRHGARLIVNDDAELALLAGADGVHLGAADGEIAVARRALPAHMVIGASCYADLERARAAVAAGADYVAFGAAFPSPSKPAAPLVPLASIAAACRELPVPVAAIGGITLANAPTLLAAGVRLLAVIGDLFAAPDIAGRARDYQSLLSGECHDYA